MNNIIRYNIFAFKIIEGLKNLDNLIRKVLQLDSKVKELAKSLFQHKSLLIMGRGYNFATCMEGALVRLKRDVFKLLL